MVESFNNVQPHPCSLKACIDTGGGHAIHSRDGVLVLLTASPGGNERQGKKKHHNHTQLPRNSTTQKTTAFICLLFLGPSSYTCEWRTAPSSNRTAGTQIWH
eukprot:277213-Amphidinium_carterae.1